MSDKKHQNPNRNSWICESERTILDSPFMRFVERHCRSSESEVRHKFYLFQSKDWCNIIPVTEDGKIVFVKQYRIGISEHTLEIPGGVMDPTDQDPQAAAIREMTEETGYAPTENFRCVSLGWTFPNPAIQDNRCHSFIVGPVKKVSDQKLDAAEMIDIVEIPIEEIPQRILNGEITHALMLNTFLFTMLRGQDSGKSLSDQLRSFTSKADYPSDSE
jgi:8-oxo-dGTP pyrophosphatase MutT (NUDIX family)